MLDLTAEEKKVLLFLCTLSLLGIGIQGVFKASSPAKSITILNQNLGKINLNRAGRDTLILIPGIGPALAQRIIEYRLENGKFNDIRELKKIKGFSEARIEQVAGLVFVE